MNSAQQGMGKISFVVQANLRVYQSFFLSNCEDEGRIYVFYVALYVNQVSRILNGTEGTTANEQVLATIKPILFKLYLPLLLKH
jgi:hypothetical protein